MKALTIRQPHASLVAIGAKSTETRDWATTYGGLLAIHAGKNLRDFWKIWDEGHQNPYSTEARVVRALAPLNINPLDLVAGDPLPTGAVVAVVRLVACTPVIECDDNGLDAAVDTARASGRAIVYMRTPSRLYHVVGPTAADVTDQLPLGYFAAGRVVWDLADTHLFPEPVPCRGAQGLWTLPADVEAAVTAQLREAVGT